MAALKQLRHELKTEMDHDIMTTEDMLNYIDNFIEIEEAKYDKLKGKKALTFGKFKGFTVKEVAKTAKGKQYLTWLLGQAWCSEDKAHFKYIHDGCKELNIKKNTA